MAIKTEIGDVSKGELTELRDVTPRQEQERAELRLFLRFPAGRSSKLGS